MSRPRKNFFIRFDELNNPEGLEVMVGGNCYHPKIGHCVITKIHPKRGGFTARKA